MRADRGLLAGTGTSVSLVAAAAVMLSVISGIIAFVGWPDVSDASDTPPLMMLADAPPESGSVDRIGRQAPSRPIVLSAPPAPAGSERARELASDPSQRRQGRSRGGQDRDGAAGTGRDQAASETTPGAPPRTGSARGEGGTVRDVASAGAGVTREATRVAGDAVAPAAPAAGQTTQGTGDAAAEMVQQTGDAVGRVLDGDGGR